ncbi:MAG: hypothetical protein ACE5Z5_11295 [Candidatus Bathyarchaeia archaeon]
MDLEPSKSKKRRLIFLKKHHRETTGDDKHTRNVVSRAASEDVKEAVSRLFLGSLPPILPVGDDRDDRDDKNVVSGTAPHADKAVSPGGFSSTGDDKDVVTVDVSSPKRGSGSLRDRGLWRESVPRRHPVSHDGAETSCRLGAQRPVVQASPVQGN